MGGTVSRGLHAGFPSFVGYPHGDPQAHLGCGPVLGAGRHARGRRSRYRQPCEVANEKTHGALSTGDGSRSARFLACRVRAIGRLKATTRSPDTDHRGLPPARRKARLNLSLRAGVGHGGCGRRRIRHVSKSRTWLFGAEEIRRGARDQPQVPPHPFQEGQFDRR